MPSLLPLDIGDPQAKLADWFELSALLSPGSETSISEIRSMLSDSLSEDSTEPDPDQDEVDLDNQISNDWQLNDDRIENEISLLQTEINQRVIDLGNEYPFSVNNTGDTLSVKKKINFGGYVYLYCLIVSHSNKEGVLNDEIRPNLSNEDRNIFQICATIAAAGEVSGPAISFGWPRPDSSTAHQKLLNTHAHFPTQAVKIRQNLLPGTPSHIKDDGIDVICWKQGSLDKNVALQYYLGQAATGLNWTQKSVNTEIPSFLNTWYDVRPHDVKGCMFIPFHPAGNIAGDEDTRLLEIRRKNDALGRIIGRQVLPKYAQMALGLDTSKIRPIERLNERAHVKDWVNRFIKDAVGADT